MKNPFPENEVFKKFLGLKDDFRRFSTPESMERFKAFARIAFDLLGSVNFGIADAESDTDIVIYLESEHEEEASYKNSPKLRFYETLLLTSLMHEVSDTKFRIQVVDCINLRRLKKKIDEKEYDDDIIARFVFYRTICRGINKNVIRSYENQIMNDKELFTHIEAKLTEALIEFTRTSGHHQSFRKYIDRLRDKNVHIPVSMIEKIMEYLIVSASE